MVGWLSDYRTSLSLKASDYFTQKIHDYLTMIRKKMLRLFHDYFIGEATTITELVTTIPAGTLRLLPTSISYRAKARKEIRR